MKIQAIIFDLNGTVLDDEKVYGEAFMGVLSQLGASVTHDPHIKGIGVSENWPILLNKYQINTDKTIEELDILTNQSYLSRFKSVKLTSGFEEFVQNVRASGMQTALATSNTWSVVDKVFEEFALERYFDTITTREEISLSKPSPEIFLLTADKLSVEPSDCLVIEDADAGIEAAKAAGMRCVAIGNDNELADVHIVDFTELTPEKMLGLVSIKSTGRKS